MVRGLLLSCAVLALHGCGGLRIERHLHERTNDWPTFGRAIDRSATADRPLIPPLTLDWEQDVTAGIGNGSPLIVDSIVFVGTLRGELYAMAEGTGKVIGWIGLGDAVQGSPVIDASVAFVPLSNSKESLVAFDLFEGKTRWKKSYGDVEVSPLLYDQKLYFGNTAGTFFCVERATGDQKWRFDIPPNTTLKGIRSSPAADGATIVFGAEDGWVYALHAGSGAMQWKAPTGSPVMASPLITAGVVYVGNRNGIVSAFDRATGKRIWRYDSGGPIFAHPVPAGDVIIIGTVAGAAIALRTRDGAHVWTADLGGPVTAGGAITGNVIYFGTLTKHVIALNTSDGTILWRADAGGRVRTSPAVVGGRLYIANDEHMVRAFKEAPR